MRDVIGRDPSLFGFDRSRWTLDMIREACWWLGDITISGIHGLLDRLDIAWKHGRDHVYSPDPLYKEKKAIVAQLAAQAEASSGEIILVYQDEVTIYRQPRSALPMACVEQMSRWLNGAIRQTRSRAMPRPSIIAQDRSSFDALRA